MDKTYNIENLKKIITDKKEGITYEKIMEKYGMSSSLLNKILKDNNMQVERLLASEIKRFLKVKDVKKVRTSSNRIEYNYLVECNCGIKKWIAHYTSIGLFKAKREYICDKCSTSFSVRCPRASGQKKRKDNTTGYIGVVVIKDYRNDSIWGYSALISSKGRQILRNKYKDFDLHEKTLIQAAVDREVFILENGLTHRRNFTDEQLLGHMLRLGMHQVEKVKDILKK